MDYNNAGITSFANHFNVDADNPIHFLPTLVFPDGAFEMEEETNSEGLPGDDV